MSFLRFIERYSQMGSGRVNQVTFSESPFQRVFKSDTYNNFILKTRHAISRAVHFYNAGVVTCDRRIWSRIFLVKFTLRKFTITIQI
jgi:hypothetical protein